MSDTVTLVERFLSAYYKGERDAARLCLTDDFTFSGPSATYDGADAFLRSVNHVAPAVVRLEREKIFEDGADVGLFYILHLNQRPGVLPVAQWFRARDGKLSSSRIIFDTGAFISLENHDAC